MIFAVLLCLGAAASLAVGHREGLGRRIIYGVEAEEDRFPYMALLYYGDEAYCGATIIHVRWALTAGHCILTEEPDPKIMVGTVNKVGGTYYHAHTLIRHGAYKALNDKDNLVGPEYVVNDIGLVRTDYDIQFNFRNVAPIPLVRVAQSYDNEIGTIVGWGKMGWLDPSYPDKLVYGKVRILPYEDCHHFYPYVEDNHICTAVDGLQSICNGDSGGPLVWNGLQIGIASTADDDCQIGDASVRPNLFTRVTSYIPWIRDQLAAYNNRLE